MLRSRYTLLFAIFLFIVSLLALDGPPKNNIHIEKNPSHEKLVSNDVYSWMTWEKEPSTFPWQFTERERVYVVEGTVHIRQDGSDQVHILEKGDYAEFAPGLRCIWEVKEPFKKHVTLEKDTLGRIYWTTVFKIKAIPRRLKKLLT